MVIRLARTRIEARPDRAGRALVVLRDLLNVNLIVELAE